MVVKRGDVLVQMDRNPLETYLLLWAASAGAFRLAGLWFGSPVPPTSVGHFPAWMDPLWYGLLLIGGIVALAGSYWRDAITGVLIVRAAMWPLGAGALLYAVAAWVDHADRSAIVVLGFGVACVLRAVQITRHVRLDGIAAIRLYGGPK